ncbi:MAG: AMP-binding protein [Terriglobales bacterium]
MPNFYERFQRSAERWPDRIAVDMQRHAAPLESYTYAQLHAMAASLAGWFGASELRRGTRCAILAANGPRWVACYLGIIAAGMVVLPFDTALNVAQVATLLQAGGASLLFVDAKHLPVAQRAAADLPIQLILLEGSPDAVSGATSFDSILAARAHNFAPANLRGEDLAAILYTSGTTSDPKGVMLTHANLSAESDAVFQFLDLGPDDAILGVLPLFHALAQMANLILPLAAGARVVFLDSLNTTELLRALSERDITLFCCVPQFFYLLHDRIRKEAGAHGRLAETMFRAALKLCGAARDLGMNPGKLLFRRIHRKLGPRMRYLITGGSRLDPAVGHDFQALGFDLLQAYGLTETSGGAVCTRPGDNVIGSVGKPLPGIEARIHQPRPPEDGSGPPVGDILIRGDIVMAGYYNRPEATAESIRDGWLHTGDLGYFDAHGNLFITGREKEIIVLSNGKNIYPEEIEAHYLKSPYVKEICVLGLQNAPGEPFAERLHAVIVPNVETLRERKIVNSREIIRFDLESLSAQLPATKRILSFDLWQEDLPRTTTRKIKRFEVERRVNEQRAAGRLNGGKSARALSEEEREWINDPLVARALRVIAEAAKNSSTPIHPRDNLELDLGLDSMERVELLVALERELGAHVGDGVASEVYSVRELVDAVRQSIGSEVSADQTPAWESVLNTDPTDAEVLSVARRKPVAERFWYLTTRMMQMAAREYFHLEVSGLEKLPARGPFILCANHQSFLDPPVLVSLLPYNIFRDTFYVGTSEIFGTGLLKALARSFRLVPVDPDANLVPAMRAGAYGLRHGKVLVLYPEGERSIDGEPKVFKKGAAILATHLRVPIVPVAMDGFYEAWPRGLGFQKFSTMRVAFGDPIVPPNNMEKPEDSYDRLNRELKARVMEMWLRLHGYQG